MALGDAGTIGHHLLEVLSSAVIQTVVPEANWLLDPLLANFFCSQVFFGKLSHPSNFQTAGIIDHCKNRFISPRLFKDLKKMHFKGRKMECSTGVKERKTCS